MGLKMNKKETIIAIDGEGNYIGKYTGCPIPEGTFPVSVDTDSAFRVWNFKTETWGEIDLPLPNKISKKLFVIKLRDEKIITQEEAIAFLGSYKFPTIFLDVLSKIQSTKERNDIELDLITENELVVSGVFITTLFKTLKYTKTQIKNFIRSIGIS